MTPTTATLASFLLARLAEDEATARAAVEHADYRGPRTPEWEASNPGEVTHVGEVYYALAYDIPSQQVAEHIARHDPERVLAEVEAKRVAVQMAESTLQLVRAIGDNDLGFRCASGADQTLRALASVYRTHPEFREEWA